MAHLDKANVGCLFSECLATHIEPILADQPRMLLLARDDAITVRLSAIVALGPIPYQLREPLP